MLSQGAAVRKRLLAQPTPVGPLPRVSPHVGGHGGGLREPTIADGTSEGFLATMSPDMRSQVGGLREGFVAVHAAVRLFARVGP